MHNDDTVFEEDIMKRDGERLGAVLREIMEERKGHFYGTITTGQLVAESLIAYLEKEEEKIDWSDHNPLLSWHPPGPDFSYFAMGMRQAFDRIDREREQRRIKEHVETFLAKHGKKKDENKS